MDDISYTLFLFCLMVVFSGAKSINEEKTEK